MDDLHDIKFTGQHVIDYCDRFDVRPGSPLTPETDDGTGRYIEVEFKKTFTRLKMNDKAVADLIEDCAYYVECMEDDEAWRVRSAKSVLRQLVKLGYQDWTIRYTEGYKVTL